MTNLGKDNYYNCHRKDCENTQKHNDYGLYVCYKQTLIKMLFIFFLAYLFNSGQNSFGQDVLSL